jgi:hypothetical protein
MQRQTIPQVYPHQHTTRAHYMIILPNSTFLFEVKERNASAKAHIVLLSGDSLLVMS